MRMLGISLGLWSFILPSIVASFLILTALAAVVPPLYFAVVWIGVAFTAVALLCGPISCGTGPLSRAGFAICPTSFNNRLIEGEKQ
jgi:hypothetical protein